MTEFESFQSSMLEKLGYHVAPFHGDCTTKYVSIKDDEFHFMDGYADDSCRELDSIKGDILLRLDKEGFHYCPSKSEEGEVIKYIPKQYKYYFLRENDKYIEVEYLDDMYLGCNDTFEVVDSEKYIAIKYNKHRTDDRKRLKEKPLLDSIIVKEKDIVHLGVFVYHYEDKIVVYSTRNDADEESNLIVYDKDFNVLYSRHFPYADSETFFIWEVEGKSYLIFPYGSVVYNLSEAKELELPFEGNRYWLSVMTYKNILVLFTQHRYPVDKSSYDDDYSDWDYDDENSPIRSTEGRIYDLSFNLLRDFNVLGQIVAIKDFDVTKVIKVDDSDSDTSITKYYKVNGDNITRYDEDDDEKFSVPDIVISSMDGYKNHYLTIVRTKLLSPDTINFGSNSNRNIVTKCGVYMEDRSGDSYYKIIDCKYDGIKPLALKDDENIYYIGVEGVDMDNKYDLYINHELFFQKYPFERGRLIKVVGNGYFIQFIDSDGKVGFIRNGEVVFKPQYNKTQVCVRKKLDYQDDNEELEFLYIVSDGLLYGICSPSSELILPIEYTFVDIDENLTIVLGRNIYDLDVDKNDESIMCGCLMEVGSYSKETNSIVTKKAKVKNDVVLLDKIGDYVWDGDFRYTKEPYSNEDDTPSSWENYTIEDSLYDALGGEMEAIWNID